MRFTKIGVKNYDPSLNWWLPENAVNAQLRTVSTTVDPTKFEALILAYIKKDGSKIHIGINHQTELFEFHQMEDCSSYSALVHRLFRPVDHSEPY